MKNFLSRILLFCFILIIINFCFKKILNRIYFDEYYKVKLNKEIYLLSDSHGGVIGDFGNGKIYNFSYGGDSYLDMKNKLNFLIKNTDVKTVIITVDDHTLSPYREYSNNYDRSSHFKSKEDFNNDVEFFKNRFLLNNLILFEPKYGVLLNQYFKSFLSLKEKKMDWSNLSEEIKIKESTERFNNQFNYNTNSSLLKTHLLDIIKLCKENNINLIGIKFPLSKSYKMILGQKSFHADKVFLKNNLRVMDFNIEELNHDIFYQDQDHLNKKGSNAFKEKFFKTFLYSL